jgi:hypothetical protein
MYQTVNTVSNFRDEFRACGRADQFSYEALGLLFEYFEAYEMDTGEEIELDVVSICCDFSEDSPENIRDQYAIDTEGMDEDEAIAEVIATLEENAAYVGKTNTGAIIYRNY